MRYLFDLYLSTLRISGAVIDMLKVFIEAAIVDEMADLVRQ